MKLVRFAAWAMALGCACAILPSVFAAPSGTSVGATLGSLGRGEPRPYDGIAAAASPRRVILQGQQERPGVPQSPPPAARTFLVKYSSFRALFPRDVFFRTYMASPLKPAPQQERPGVPQGAPPATFSITRHGKIVFEADVREPDSPRVVLTESIEISGLKSPQGWTEFVSAFVKATSQEWLRLISPSVAQKKGKVTIAFALRRDGSLEGALSIPKSSGDSAIDDATRLAIAKSAPFRELPSSFLGAVAQFRVTFVYNRPHPLAPLSANTAGATP